MAHGALCRSKVGELSGGVSCGLLYPGASRLGSISLTYVGMGAISATFDMVSSADGIGAAPDESEANS